MALQNLPISRLIAVDVVLTPLSAQAQNLSTLLILGNSDVVDVTERLRIYTTITEVVADFGTSAPEYLAAVLWFEQNPQPTQLMIGRWAATNTKGKLNGGVLSASQALIATWNAISSGGFSVAIDGGSVQHLSGLNFTGVTNLNGVATVVNAALTGAVMTYNANMNRFEIESATSGASSDVTFLTPPNSGVDISGTLAMTSVSSGAYEADGIVAETALSAATLFDTLYGQQWYALTVLGAADSDHEAIAPFIEAANNKHLYGITTQEAGVLSSASTTDIAYILKQLRYKRSVVQYSSSNAYAVCSLLGRALTVNYTGNSTVITLMYKQEPGIVAESVTETQIDVLESKECNVFVAYNNNTAITEPGVVSSGDFIDTITGTDWLAVTIMTELYNLLYTSPTKIPQTDAGTHLLVTTIEKVCVQGVVNGLLAPGVWNSAGFGTLNQDDFLPKGFYVFAPRVGTQLESDRVARKSVPIQVAAKLAGAVHTVDVTINVNR